MRAIRDLADGEILLSVMRDINPEETGGSAEIGGDWDQKLGKIHGKTMEKPGKPCRECGILWKWLGYLMVYFERVLVKWLVGGPHMI